MNVFDVFAKLSLNTSEYDKGLQTAEKSANSFGGKLKKSFGTAVKLGTAITATGGAVVASVSKMAMATADYGDKVDKTAQKLGLSNEAYQKWDYVMNLAGTDMSSMTVGLKTLTNQLGQATSGNKDAIKSFKELGISEKELGKLSREDLFAKSIEGLQKMGDTTERAVLANKLFGKSGQNLTPLFNQSAEATKELMETAEKYGMVMSDDAVKASAEFKDSLTTLEMTTQGAKNRLMGEFLPAITKVTDGLSKMFVGDTDEGLEEINKGITDFLNKTSESLPQIMEVGTKIVASIAQGIISNLPQLFIVGVDTIKIIGQSLMDMLPTLIDAGESIIIMLVKGINDGMSSFAENADSIIETLMGYLESGLPKFIEFAGNVVVALANGLLIALPILIEKLPTIMDTIASTLIALAPKLFDIGINIITTLFNGILAMLPTLGATMVQAFFDLIPLAVEAFKNLKTNAISILKMLGSTAVSLIANMGKSIVKTIGSMVSSVGSNLGKLGSIAWNAIKNMASKLVSGARSAVTNAVSEIGKIGGKIKAKLSEVATNAFTWGKDIIDSIGSGIRSAIGNLTKPLTSVADKIKSFLHFSEPDVGPLSDFHTYMPDMIDLMIQGINDNKGKLANTVEEMAKELADPIKINGEVDLSANYSATSKDDEESERVENQTSIVINVYGDNKTAKEIAEEVRRNLITEENRRRLSWL